MSQDARQIHSITVLLTSAAINLRTNFQSPLQSTSHLARSRPDIGFLMLVCLVSLSHYVRRQSSSSSRLDALSLSHSFLLSLRDFVTKRDRKVFLLYGRMLFLSAASAPGKLLMSRPSWCWRSTGGVRTALVSLGRSASSPARLIETGSGQI